MTMGTPLLLDGGKIGLLSRLTLKADADQPYPESLLQEQIDRFPNMLPINDFYPGVKGVCSLGREIPVDLGGVDGYVDNLLLTDDGHFVVVETKLWRNPEALRTVVAQILQYGMSVSRLSLDELESRVRRGTGDRRLGADETILQRARSVLPEMADDFEEVFDRLRHNSEMLLLIVGDGIRSSVERLVQWVNEAFGSEPCKFGLVQLSFFDLPDGGRIIVPGTLMRTREVSRHVVSISLRGTDREQVTVTVSAPDERTHTRKVSAPGPALTEQGLTDRIRAKQPQEIVSLTDELRTKLDSLRLAKRALPATIQYGVEVDGDFIPLVSLQADALWFQMPKWVTRMLGGDGFVACKQKINEFGEFYRAEDVADPDKTSGLCPRYGVLQGKVDEFVSAVADIAEEVRIAMRGTS